MRAPLSAAPRRPFQRPAGFDFLFVYWYLIRFAGKSPFYHSALDMKTFAMALMRSDYREPLNLGQDRMVSINELADIIGKIAGIEVSKRHVDGPQGVRGRNSDNSRLRRVLEWEPEVSLEQGLAVTYAWIEEQLSRQLAVEERAA